MKILGNQSRPEVGCAVTIGQFDGVHIGHRGLIEQTRRRAVELGCASAVVTFDRHPASIVRPESAPALLTDLDQKLELLAETGIDYTLVLRFDEERAQESAEVFVEDVLIDRLGAKAVVVGHDFHFGNKRAGNVGLLETMGKANGFVVQSVGPVCFGDHIVSSTLIREILRHEGNATLVTSALGHPYELRGLVVMGDGRGRELGFPTANVTVDPSVVMPADGVYAGEYEFPDGSTKLTSISVGTRPTFYEDGVRLVEAYVIDFDGDLYGQRARVRFLKRLRGQEKYEGVSALIEQLKRDVEATRSAVP